jgi:molecular chaperone HscB
MSMKNPYKIFGIKESFVLDLELLEDMYLQLQVSSNPDIVEFLDKNEAHQKTTEINNAYQILKDPIKRAEFLLVFFGGCDFRDNISKDQNLLAEIMEIIENNDHITTQEIVDNLWKELEKYFQDKNWEQAKLCYSKIRYFKKHLSDNN